MEKDRNITKNIDWGSMARNNQYKSAPNINKDKVAEPKPALARVSNSGKLLDGKAHSKKNK